MIIVYATGTPRYLEFHVTQGRRAVPRHATPYAIYEAGRYEELCSEHTFNALTDAEYYGFQAAVRLAQGLEARRLRRVRNRNLFYRALRWLNAFLFGRPLAGSLRNN